MTEETEDSDRSRLQRAAEVLRARGSMRVDEQSSAVQWWGREDLAVAELLLGIAADSGLDPDETYFPTTVQQGLAVASAVLRLADASPNLMLRPPAND